MAKFLKASNPSVPLSILAKRGSITGLKDPDEWRRGILPPPCERGGNWGGHFSMSSRNSDAGSTLVMNRWSLARVQAT